MLSLFSLPDIPSLPSSNYRFVGENERKGSEEKSDYIVIITEQRTKELKRESAKNINIAIFGQVRIRCYQKLFHTLRNNNNNCR